MNITSSSLTAAERRFIDELASLLAPWGMPTSSGRVYGYVLLRREPVSLDQIAADLEMSKGGAWNAAKLLERFDHVRRYGEPGSKRALYGPSDNIGAPLLAQSALLGAIGELMQGFAASAGTGEPASRLKARGGFYIAVREAIEAAIEKLSPLPASADARRGTARRAGSFPR